MNKKIISVTLLVLLLIVSGCTPSPNNETEVIQNTEEEATKTVIIPSLQLDEKYYRTILPYEESASRGLVVSNLATKYDMKEVETGLLGYLKMSFHRISICFKKDNI